MNVFELCQPHERLFQFGGNCCAIFGSNGARKTRESQCPIDILRCGLLGQPETLWTVIPGDISNHFVSGQASLIFDSMLVIDLDISIVQAWSLYLSMLSGQWVLQHVTSECLSGMAIAKGEITIGWNLIILPDWKQLLLQMLLLVLMMTTKTGSSFSNPWTIKPMLMISRRNRVANGLVKLIGSKSCVDAAARTTASHVYAAQFAFNSNKSDCPIAWEWELS